MEHPKPTTLEAKAETAGNNVIQYLRNIVSPAGKQGSCLRDLSDKQLVDIYNRLKIGQSCRKLSYMIQNDWTLHKTLNVKSIERAIRAFRDKALTPLETIPEKYPGAGPITTKQDLEDFRVQRKRDLAKARYHVEELDVLGRLRWAINKQTERCARWDSLEVVSNKETGESTVLHMDGAREDYRLLGQLCEKAIRLEMDLGVRERMPNEIILTQKHRFDALIRGLPDDGSQLIQAADKLLEAAEAEMKTLEIGPDGIYRVRESTESERVKDLALGICGGIAVSPDHEVESEEIREPDFGEPGSLMSDNRS